MCQAGRVVSHSRDMQLIVAGELKRNCFWMVARGPAGAGPYGIDADCDRKKGEEAAIAKP